MIILFKLFLKMFGKSYQESRELKELNLMTWEEQQADAPGGK
tara:strand:- start:398 stop:523 length:126 start_codon:yes stop_codon:yes gene_type:complete